MFNYISHILANAAGGAPRRIRKKSIQENMPHKSKRQNYSMAFYLVNINISGMPPDREFIVKMGGSTP
jgi:hypothetical protein